MFNQMLPHWFLSVCAFGMGSFVGMFLLFIKDITSRRWNGWASIVGEVAFAYVWLIPALGFYKAGNAMLYATAYYWVVGTLSIWMFVVLLRWRH